MSGGSFARPPAEGNLDELAVWAHGSTAGWELAVEIGRPTITHLRDQLDAALSVIARRDAEAQADADALVEHVRGDTRSHLEVLRVRAERSQHPELYADQIARAEARQARVWASWPTPTTSTRSEGEAA